MNSYEHDRKDPSRWRDVKENQIQQHLFQNYILPWAQNLPHPQRIFDLAAGQGIEAAALSKNGFDVTAIDGSDEYIHNSYYEGNLIHSDLETFKQTENSISGALIKDAWTFFNPPLRDKLLGNLHLSLAPEGSILIITQQWSINRIHYIPYESTYPVKEVFHDYDTWESQYDYVHELGTPFSMEFITTLENMQVHAESNGFEMHILKKYDVSDRLAIETRWVGTPGFICELKKQ